MQGHRLLLLAIPLALLSSVDVYAQARAASTMCERLVAASLPNTTVSSAQSVAAGQFTPPVAQGAKPAAPYADLPAFCRVVASTKMLNSDVKFEVWLPTQGWTGDVMPAGSTVDFDPVAAVRAWKTSGKAPDSIVVETSGNGWPGRKRLACAYPNVSKYKGSGDRSDPANFACGAP